MRMLSTREFLGRWKRLVFSLILSPFLFLEASCEREPRVLYNTHLIGQLNVNLLLWSEFFRGFDVESGRLTRQLSSRTICPRWIKQSCDVDEKLGFFS